mmetsp:Transcript_34144/g.38845  ORF Transcript_34144/g.38845 Transcript_34144/m.38845 type:complete len:97 (+) Transcript_34144:57-347(+)
MVSPTNTINTTMRMIQQYNEDDLTQIYLSIRLEFPCMHTKSFFHSCCSKLTRGVGNLFSLFNDTSSGSTERSGNPMISSTQKRFFVDEEDSLIQQG